MKLILIRVSATLRNTYYYIIGFIAGLFTKPSKKYIMFSSFSGDKFNDSPKAIFDYLVNEDYILVYSFKNKIDIENFNKEYPQHIAVKYNSFKHYFYLKKAKTWIFNFKTPPYFIKDKDTTFIQTWHGIPLKRLGCDIINENQRFYRSKQTYQQMVQSYIDEGKKADYFIGVSPYCKDKLKSAFKLNDNQFIDIGYPRNYKLYQDNNIELIKQELGIEQSKKVILYAPTWRDDAMNLHGFTSDFILDLDNLVKELGEDYIVLYRPHYLIKNDINFNNKNIINVAAYQDLTALFLISDLLITDYSSLYFDYAIMQRPIYFYMPDLSNYKDNLRGFYINIDSDLPNDYYIEDNELISAIKNNIINEDKWNNFLKNNENFKLDMKVIKDIVNK